MNSFIAPTATRTTICLFSFLIVAATTSAQSDTVYTRGESNVRGAVIDTRAEGVQVKKGAKPEAIPVADILKIMFDGDPPALTKGRELANRWPIRTGAARTEVDRPMRK